MINFKKSVVTLFISSALSACGFDGKSAPEIQESQKTIKEKIGGKGQTSNNEDRVSLEIKETIGGRGQDSLDKERSMSKREGLGGHGQSSFDLERELTRKEILGGRGQEAVEELRIFVLREILGGRGQTTLNENREIVIKKENLSGKGQGISTGKPSPDLLDKWKKLEEFEQANQFATHYDVSSNLPMGDLELVQYKENDTISLSIADSITLLQDINTGSIEGLFTSIGNTYIDDFSEIRIMTPNGQSGFGEISCQLEDTVACDYNFDLLTDVSFFDENITFAEETRTIRINGVEFEANDLSKNQIEYTLSVPNGEIEILADYLWSDKFGVVEVDATINVLDKEHYDDGTVEEINKRSFNYKAENAKLSSL